MWPDDQDLAVEVEAAFGADRTADPGTWSWTDLSGRLLADPTRIRSGRQGSAQQVAAGSCTVTLDNDDAALTPRHPLSPYWPNVELGTPLRVRLRRAEDVFARTVSSGWGTADSGQAWTTVGVAADYSVAAGVARHSHTAGNLYRRTMLAVRLLDVEQVVDVATPALLTGSALVTGVIARFTDPQNYYWLRCELNAGGTSIQLKITKRVGGVETQLAAVDPLPGIPYAAGVPLRVRASVVGSRLAVKAWTASASEPAGWQLTATDSSLTAAGATGVQTWLVPGNTNTLPLAVQIANYSARVDRFSGTADQWDTSVITTTTTGRSTSATRITASGILRRLGQGTPPALSPMRRTISASGPLAYYPVEDGVLATQGGAAVPGQSAATVSGDVEFRPVDDFELGGGVTVQYGAAALADLSGGGRIDATVPSAVTAGTQTRWTVHVAARADITTTSSNVVLMEWTCAGGTYRRWQLVSTTTSRTQVICYDAAGASVLVHDRPNASVGFDTFAVTAVQSGANIVVDYAHAAEDTVWSTTVAGTLSGVVSIATNPTGATSTISMPFGHLAVWASDHVPYRMHIQDVVREARRSYLQEPAHARLIRLCAEDGVALDTPDPIAEGAQRMGWQEVDTSLDLYRECADVDLGVLHEQGYGLAYLPRYRRYNPPTTLLIDLAIYQVVGGSGSAVLAPVYDDQDIVNEVTVERAAGSFAVAADLASQKRRGRYDDSVELNLADDSSLTDQAGWRLHLGNTLDLREQAFPIDLAANPDLIDGWLSCRVGSRIVRTNPPSTYPPGTLDRVVDGWQEILGPRQWQVTVNGSPAGPWDVAVADGDARVPADGSTLASGITATATAVPIASTPANGPWTEDPADMPVDVRVGGERVTLAAIYPAAADVYGRTVTGGWGTATTEHTWATSGGSSSDYSVVGG